ncbi:MAG TPA: hypothetical protein VJZ71_18270 [Phycisphaerae bacterium]|nr:hypothetical protein [Phycisphaerae bacterium]
MSFDNLQRLRQKLDDLPESSAPNQNPKFDGPPHSDTLDNIILRIQETCTEDYEAWLEDRKQDDSLFLDFLVYKSELDPSVLEVTARFYFTDGRGSILYGGLEIQRESNVNYCLWGT